MVNSFALSGSPVVGANYVALPFTAVPAASYLGNMFYTNDPLGISTADSTNLGGAFCAADWVMKLAPTQYQIDTSTPSDPRKLTRTQNGVTDIIAEQNIGFKVGAATWNVNLLPPAFRPIASTRPMRWQPPRRAHGDDFEFGGAPVRVTMIGRTTPNPDPTYTFRNAFDGGPYQVSDATVCNQSAQHDHE